MLVKNHLQGLPLGWRHRLQDLLKFSGHFHLSSKWIFSLREPFTSGAGGEG